MNKRISLLGVPYDAGTNADTAPIIDSRNGPAAIRKSLAAILQGYEIGNPLDDCGDLVCQNTVESLLTALQKRLETFLSDNSNFIVLGGAHTLTLGALRALHAQGREYSLLYFDAHPDILPEEKIHYGSTLYHAIQEGALDPRRIAYVGIRQIESPEQKLIDDLGILQFSSLDVLRLGTDRVINEIKTQCPGPFYVSIDLDSMDLSYAPGISTPSPFGLSPREVLTVALAFCDSQTIGAEIVELAPINDEKERTSKLAAAMLVELARSMVKG